MESLAKHWIDPDSLKPLKAKVARFLFNPKGDADGMLLSNGQEAHFPPHLSSDVLSAIQTGDAVTLYGVKPRSSETLACVAIETAKGERIDDRGPPDKKKKKQGGKEARNGHDADVERAEVEDTVERLLHGPKGEVRGILLAGASIVRFPPHLAEHLRHLLTPGAAIAVRGDARTVHGAIVIEAEAVGHAKVLGVTQARVSDLKRGKIDRFSMDLLVRLAARAGLKPKLKLAA